MYLIESLNSREFDIEYDHLCTPKISQQENLEKVNEIDQITSITKKNIISWNYIIIFQTFSTVWRNHSLSRIKSSIAFKPKTNFMKTWSKLDKGIFRTSEPLRSSTIWVVPKKPTVSGKWRRIVVELTIEE